MRNGGAVCMHGEHNKQWTSSRAKYTRIIIMCRNVKWTVDTRQIKP